MVAGLEAGKKPSQLPTANFGQWRRRYVRVELIACAEAGYSPEACAWSSACAVSTARIWLERWQGEENLNELPRSGRPVRITEQSRLKVVAFYCQKQPLPGINRWTLSTAKNYLEEHPEVMGSPVSRATIARILKSHGLKPHLTKYFLQITDPEFFTKMQPIIELNCNPPEHLFYFDECPGIQALARVDAELPPGEKLIRIRGFDYKRNGTSDVMAFLEARTGQVFARCTANHKHATLIEVFEQHVKAQPDDAELHYVMDNLSPHFHDAFCRAVAQLCGESYDGLATGKERREWLQNRDKRITIYFTPFHGSWLNLVEIWFGILNRHCLKEMDFESVELLREWIEQFIETWNTEMAHPFNWTYTGEGLHGKALRRFCQWLSLESSDVSCGFLTKQLLLSTNLINQFSKEVETSDWEKFREVFVEKTGYIERIIQNESKPRVRKKAIRAHAQLKLLVPELPAILES